MQTTQFPIFRTKIKTKKRKFNLANPSERADYFQLKAGPEIKKIKDHLKKGNTFIAYLLGKKNSGKGTYAKLFIEAINPASLLPNNKNGKIAHLSVGDIIRQVSEEVRDKKKKKELIKFLQQNYRGYISIDEAIEALLSREAKTLLPSEFILALVKREIDKMPRKALFLDGFPRNLDQISYSLFFRDLINYRQDPDVFALIDVPMSVIDERIKYRRICPKCQTSRNLKLLPTQKIGYDEKKKEFYLICDNPACDNARMIGKEGDNLGMKPIKKRLELDAKLIKHAFSLYGIPKITLRNCIPKEKAKEFVDDYEITPQYSYKWDKDLKEVKIIEEPWLIFDDDKELSYSLLAAPVAVAMIKQMAEVLHL